MIALVLLIGTLVSGGVPAPLAGRDHPCEPAPPPPGAVVVDDAGPRVEITAYWRVVRAEATCGAIGESVLSDDGVSADGVVRLRTAVEEAGTYEIFVYWPTLRDSSRALASAAIVEVLAATGRHAFTLDQRAGAGCWHPLGTFRLEPGRETYVEFRNDAAGGVMLVDAVAVRKVGAMTNDQ